MAFFPRNQKSKPFWISLEQEMMEWQQARCPSCRPTNSVKALNAQGKSQSKDRVEDGEVNGYGGGVDPDPHGVKRGL